MTEDNYKQVNCAQIMIIILDTGIAMKIIVIKFYSYYLWSVRNFSHYSLFTLRRQRKYKQKAVDVLHDAFCIFVVRRHVGMFCY